MSPFSARKRTPAQSSSAFIVSLPVGLLYRSIGGLGKIGPSDLTFQGEPVDRQRFDPQMVAVDGKDVLPEFKAKLFFIIGADLPEMLDLQNAAGPVHTGSAVKPGGRLPEHSPEPAEEGEFLLLFCHAVPSLR